MKADFRCRHVGVSGGGGGVGPAAGDPGRVPGQPVCGGDEAFRGKAVDRAGSGAGGTVRRNLGGPYAAKGGSVAADGKGRNSPCSTALLAHMEEPGLEVGLMFRKVRDAVLKATGGEQKPFVYGSLSSKGVYFSRVPVAAPGTSAPGGTAKGLVKSDEQLFWETVKESRDPPRGAAGYRMRRVASSSACPPVMSWYAECRLGSHTVEFKDTMMIPPVPTSMTAACRITNNAARALPFRLPRLTSGIPYINQFPYSKWLQILQNWTMSLRKRKSKGWPSG